MSTSKPDLPIEHDILKVIADRYGTPAYVYDKKTIIKNFRLYEQAFQGRSQQICYAVKANSNLAIIKCLADLGAGFDIVSKGELQRVLLADGVPGKTIFSGVGKTTEDIALALLVGIGAFDVESIAELETIIAVAQEMDVVAPISIRLNPDVDAKTHPYISTGLKDNKFGLTADAAWQAYRMAKRSRYIDIVGINMHIGSQITDIRVFEDACRKQSQFIKRLKNELGIALKHINLGGGIGVRYQNEKTISIRDWAHMVCSIYQDSDVTLVMEPGRSLVADAGILLTRVIYGKVQADNRFIIVDAAMNDYLRPALYQAKNHISNINRVPSTPTKQHIVGPVCESADCFAKDVLIEASAGDVLAFHDMGAYGFVMASNYNTRERPAEVFVDGDDFSLVRRRETFDDLIAHELIGELALESEGEDQH